MENSQEINQLLVRLDAQRDAFLESFRAVHELLAQNIAASAGAPSGQPAASTGTPTSEPEQRSPRPSVTRPDPDRVAHIRKTSTGLNTITTSSGSRRTGEDSDNDDDGEDYYVATPLEPRSHGEESLRKHLQSYKWNPYGAKILETVIDTPSRMLQSPLMPMQKGPVEDGSHYSHCQVFDVGPDGAPLQFETSTIERETSRANAIWQAIREVNQPSKDRLAVGRITVLRELSPILFGAVHHTLHQDFDMDELFRHLVVSDGTSANMHRAFDDDVRRQRSFVFNFEYFTIIGESPAREPMKWQLSDRQGKRREHNIAVTRCSSVVALVLNGKAIQKVKNPSRHRAGSYGYAYDPWSSWQVLNLQCYPDWHASMDVHDATHHYVNGPEAFLVTLLGEYKDAQKRFEHVYREISDLIMLPLEFMFDSDIRDRLLFEDEFFTMSRRYFWAYQTLGLMNESIISMIDAYERTFTDEVWAGRHRTLWPLLDQNSPRNRYYKEKRMAPLRAKFDAEMDNLRKLIAKNDLRREKITGLKEDLFTGTSIQESRKSVENTEITIQQGHNIKLLTLVSIFFLPLTFVTSVFGMSNMPTAQHYNTFGIVTAVVCVPFFVLIGSLNTTRGMHFWHEKSRVALHKLAIFIAWLFGCGRKRDEKEIDLDEELDVDIEPLPLRRSTTPSNPRDARMRRVGTMQNGHLSRHSVEMKKVESRDRDRSSGDQPAAGLQTSQTSRLAEMWSEERRRTLKFSSNV
ncbi:hypothetical protein KC334_g4225 [Hortaea werneckii]|uniref:Uncharacterized protein n=1 Tax=Hortaea werneckii TaxID=91943 RepID=A0A3M7BEP4_HORWE|nr:hypothetical protein KC334_g4225 [Hortaea werneckii]RMY38138.1 hypothetical protein D0866_02805 [Hortaea werneckii]